MKQNRSLTILAITLVSLGIFLFIFDRIRASKQRKQESIESAKTAFLKQFDATNGPIDSTYANNDTVRFYRNDSLMGMSVITID